MAFEIESTFLVIQPKPGRPRVEDAWDLMAVDVPLPAVVDFPFCPVVAKLLNDFERIILLDDWRLLAAGGENKKQWIEMS